MSRYDRNVHARRIIARAGYTDGGTIPADSAPEPPDSVPVYQPVVFSSGFGNRVINPYALPAGPPKIRSPIPAGDSRLVFGPGVRMPGAAKRDEDVA